MVSHSPTVAFSGINCIDVDVQVQLYGPALPAFIKFAIVFIGTLSLSWATTIALRQIRLIGRMI